MPNQYTSEKNTLGELLSMTSPPIEVPDFQRNFSWSTSAVETFWQDVMSFSNQYSGNNITEQEYFLGSTVMVNTGAKHLLLDGQQRLATASILLSVIRDFLTEYSSDAGTRTAQKYITDFDDATGSHAFKLTLNRYDRDFFRREIQEPRTPEYVPATPELASHKLIRQAREFFAQRFRDKYEEIGGGKNAFDWSLRVRLVLTDHVSVVAVSSIDEDNASTVFETLNDRGIGLSTPELLRMPLLRRASEPEREEIIESWHDVLEMEEDAKVDDFLRHYWLSHRGDVKTRSLYREIKGTIVQEGTDSLTFSRDLSQTAAVYRDIAAGRDEDHDIRRLLESINMLGAKPLMPSILSAYASGSLEQKKAVLQALITLYVRHSVIGNLENSRLETVVFNIAKDLRQTNNVNAAINAAKEFAPSDDEFVDRFKTAQIQNRGQARYVLRELEHAKRLTAELAVEAPDRVHVEHIYPQSPQAKWPNHTSVVDRLGNLTLLSRRLNVTIKNSDFQTKRPYYEQSDLLLTRELLDYVEWDRATIDSRQTQLSEYTLAIWNFPEFAGA